MRKLISRSLLALALGLSSLPCWATINDAEAMNLSGMQRMLSQRIAKSYLMIGTQVRSEQAIEQLDQSVARFESNFMALTEYAPNKAIAEALDHVESTWQSYRELALSHPTREQAVWLLQLSDRLLEQSEAVVRLVETHTGSADARLVNRSGRQRMLSQRIAKLYLAMSWNLPIHELPQQLQQATSEFEAAQQELLGAEQNTPQIAAALKKVDAQWRFARAGFSLSADAHYVPTVIATTTETLLKQMNELTSAYEEVMRQKS